METQPPLQLVEFQNGLDKRVTIFQIIALALFLGVTIFLGIVLFLYSQNQGQENPQQVFAPGILPMLSIVHLCMACGNYIAAFFVYQYFVNPKRLATVTTFSPNMPPQPEMPTEVRACGLIFTGFIIRAAMLEGIAIFGIVACLMGITEGTIYKEPVYWLNLFSYVIFAAVILWAFPTKERLETIFQRRFMEQGQIFDFFRNK